MGAMIETELHPGLKNAYRKLGKTITLIGDIHAAQGTAEASTLSDTFTYHSSDAFIVKETLTNRQILMRELLQAQQTTRSKLSATDRLKSSTSVRRDKVDEAIAALDEARQHEKYLLEKTDRVTANLVQDNRKWFTIPLQTFDQRFGNLWYEKSKLNVVRSPPSKLSALTCGLLIHLEVCLGLAVKRIRHLEDRLQ